jgi:hypothetical protein
MGCVLAMMPLEGCRLLWPHIGGNPSPSGDDMPLCWRGAAARHHRSEHRCLARQGKALTDMGLQSMERSQDGVFYAGERQELCHQLCRAVMLRRARGRAVACIAARGSGPCHQRGTRATPPGMDFAPSGNQVHQRAYRRDGREHEEELWRFANRSSWGWAVWAV